MCYAASVLGSIFLCASHDEIITLLGHRTAHTTLQAGWEDRELQTHCDLLVYPISSPHDSVLQA